VATPHTQGNLLARSVIIKQRGAVLNNFMFSYT